MVIIFLIKHTCLFVNIFISMQCDSRDDFIFIIFFIFWVIYSEYTYSFFFSTGIYWWCSVCQAVIHWSTKQQNSLPYGTCNLLGSERVSKPKIMQQGVESERWAVSGRGGGGKEVVFDQKIEWCEERKQVRVSGRGISRCKGLEAGSENSCPWLVETE